MALVAVLVPVFLTAADWGDGATRVGVVAVIAAAVVGIGAGVRALAGRFPAQRRQQFLHAGIVCAVLIVLSAGSVASVSPLHTAQARTFESQHAWQHALDAYERGGATAPTSTDLARVYNEWGEALAAQGHYGLALEKFNVVVQQYANVAQQVARAGTDLARVYNAWGEALAAQGHYSQAVGMFGVVLHEYAAVAQQVARAKHDLVTAYFSWTRAALDQQDYPDAASAIGTLLGLSLCDAACQRDAAPLAVSAYLQAAQHAVQVGQYAVAIQGLEALLAMSLCDVACQDAATAQEATASYQEAESFLTAGSATQAVSAFRAILARFPNSPEAQRLHPDLAKALLQVGEQQLQASCTSALPTYQDLAVHFADTPEGQQAAAALAAPQPVTGRFTKVVPVGSGVVLTWGLHAGMTNWEVASAWGIGYPFDHWVFHWPDGYFRLAPVPPGDYDLMWWVSGGGGFGYAFATNPDGSPTYVAHVQPLCPFDFGDIPEDFPSTP
jgi:tetratricopeptide (TPR) repeat protein